MLIRNPQEFAGQAADPGLNKEAVAGEGIVESFHARGDPADARLDYAKAQGRKALQDAAEREHGLLPCRVLL
jgi:hypothetical protein